MNDATITLIGILTVALPFPIVLFGCWLIKKFSCISKDMYCEKKNPLSILNCENSWRNL